MSAQEALRLVVFGSLIEPSCMALHSHAFELLCVSLGERKGLPLRTDS